MSNEVKWKAPTNRTTGIEDEIIAGGANKLGSEINNESNADRYLALEMQWAASDDASTAGEAMEVYLVYALDGSTYEDGGDAVDPTKSPSAIFIDDGTTDAQRQTITGIPLDPFKFKILLKSEFTNQASGIYLDAETYNEEVQ